MALGPQPQYVSLRRKDTQREVGLALVPLTGLAWLPLGVRVLAELERLVLLSGPTHTSSLFAEAAVGTLGCAESGDPQSPTLESAGHAGSWNVTSRVRPPGPRWGEGGVEARRRTALRRQHVTPPRDLDLVSSPQPQSPACRPVLRGSRSLVCLHVCTGPLGREHCRGAARGAAFSFPHSSCAPRPLTCCSLVQ